MVYFLNENLIVKLDLIQIYLLIYFWIDLCPYTYFHTLSWNLTDGPHHTEWYNALFNLWEVCYENLISLCSLKSIEVSLI